MAQSYPNDNVSAPLYRLPLLAYAHALPQLLTDGELDGQNARSLTAFYNEAQTLNRDLNQAEDSRQNEAKLAAEYNRNCMKAKRLAGEFYDAAKNAIRSKIRSK